MAMVKQEKVPRLVELRDEEVQQIFCIPIVKVMTALQMSSLLGYTLATIKHLAASPQKNATKIPPPIKNRRGENVWDIETVTTWLQTRNETIHTPVRSAEGQQ